MKPTYVRINNYRTLRDVSLDLTFPAAAITGPNGAGKSSLVESMFWCLYGDSRSTLKDAVIRNGETDCAVELHFDHEGSKYRIIRKRSRDGKADLQLMHFSMTEWMPLSGSSMPDTQKRINSLLAMDSKLFQLTSYVGQESSAGICAAKPAERKDILYQIFEDQMSAFPGLQDAAKKAASDVLPTITSIRTIDLPRCEQAARDLVSSKHSRELAVEDERVAQANYDASRKLLDELAELAVVAEKRAGVLARISNIDGQVRDDTEKVRILDANYESLLRQEEEARAAETAAAARVQALRTELGVFDGKYQKSVDIDNQAAIARREYDAKVLQIQQKYQEDSSALTQSAKEHDMELQRLRLGLDNLSTERSGALRRSELLTTVPCVSDTTMQSSCPLLAGARKDAESLADYDQRMSDIRVNIIEKSRLADAARADLMECSRRKDKDLGRVKDVYDELAGTYETLRANLLYSQRDHEQCRKNLQEAELTQTGQVAVIEGRINTNRTLRDESRQRLEACARQREQAEQELAVIPEVDESLPSQRKDAEFAHQMSTSDLHTAQRNVAQVDARIEALDKDASRVDGLYEELTRLERQRTIYQLLVQAFGKDGIPALIIDSMVPALEASANDVLSQLSDGRMTIKFATLRAKQDGGIKETLDIIITDADGERAYEDWSGGEKLRINLAVRVALGEMLAARQGARIEPLFLDEVCAPLDVAGENALMDCVEKLSKRFGPIFLLTHREVLSDRMPTQITVDKGTVKVTA